MGSLETVTSLKKDSLLPRSSRTEKSTNSFLHHRPLRSRFSRFLLFKKLDYLQWICTVAVFLFFVVLFQMFLPGSVVEKSEEFYGHGNEQSFEQKLGLSFGENVKIEPLRLMKKFNRESSAKNLSFGHNRTLKRFGYRKPQLAVIFADLLVHPSQVLMVTVAAALQEIGYEIQVYSIEDGPVREIWTNLGVPVSLIHINSERGTLVDWLNYDGIIVDSLEAKHVLSCLMHEPFKSITIIWTIHDRALAVRSRHYNSSGQVELLNDWKKVFHRASVVVFPNYYLAMLYSTFDSGNYYVIPGSPAKLWEANSVMSSHKNLRVKMGIELDDIVLAIIGSTFSYKGMWLDHALVLEALLPLISESSIDKNSNTHLKIIVLTGGSSSNYSKAIEAITLKLQYPNGIVKHLAADEHAENVPYIADVLIYGSFLDEHTFPDILMKAMFLKKPIIAPDSPLIRKYVDDGVNGYIFPRDNTQVLFRIVSEMTLNGEVSAHAHDVASVGSSTAKNLMVSETVEAYALLLENVLKLPSEVAAPNSVSEVPPNMREEWKWDLFEVFFNKSYYDRTSRSYRFLDKVEEEWNQTQKVNHNPAFPVGGSFVYEIWEDQKEIDVAIATKKREEEELKGRGEQFHATWEDVYRSAKKADRSKNDLHERDEGELIRTGQVLTIYEPYYGQGAWPFLHHASLYRGICFLTKGRRLGTDDFDASSRLPLLSNSYYRDALGEYGAFFAMANRIDRVHKNAWIGFQSWRATAKKASLSTTAENALVDAIQRRRHGDTLYFWFSMDKDPRNPFHKDFWSFCDAINAGNCRFAFSEALKRMYGMKPDFNSFPPMPADGDAWSVMHSWALPTKSFLEFVMFSRMFVDALDAQIYDEHHQNSSCYLSLSKDKHCYSRLLELLVNVWAYHSARRMVYVDPHSGIMQERHKLNTRRGHMWIRWFSYTTLKNMDEELAEMADSEHQNRRWLWPLTGEVFWQGMLEKEKTLQRKQKEKRKQLSRDKLSRMRKKNRQKAIGKYIKPPPEASNTTVAAELLTL